MSDYLLDFAGEGMTMMNLIKLKAIICISTILLSACEEKFNIDQEVVLRSVKTQTIETRQFKEGREFTGIVDTRQKVDLAFRISGTLTSLFTNEGDKVKRGQIVAKLDDTDIKIKLKAVRADFQKSEVDFNRATSLIDGKLISQSDFDKIHTQFLVSQAEYEKVQKELEYTQLKAHFDGVVSKRYVENLSEINAKNPIVSLVNLDKLVVRIEVPESLMIHVNRQTHAPKLYAIFDNNLEFQYPLEIFEVANQPEPGTQTYLVTLALPYIDNFNVLPGMSVRVLAKPHSANNKASVLAYLPAHAILEDRESRFVYVAVPVTDSEAVVESRRIVIGELSDSGIEIIRGLEQGDRVITAGMSQLTEGQPVRLDRASTGGK